MVVLVTGSAGGIGSRVVRRLRSSGHDVLATDVVEVPETGHTLDVRSAEGWQSAIDAAISRWGCIDTLINLAGVATAGRFDSIDPSEIDRHFDINFKGAALGTRLLLPHMLERGSGRIVNVCSLAGLAPVPGIALYSATKHALRAWSLALSLELEGTGVGVTVIHPDLVDTPMIEEQRDQPEAALSFSGARILAPDEVAAAIVDCALGRLRAEVGLPRTRAALCKLAGAMPGMSRALQPLLRRRGLQRQAEERARKEDDR